MDLFEAIVSNFDKLKDYQNFIRIFPDLLNSHFQKKGFRLEKPPVRDVVTARTSRSGTVSGRSRSISGTVNKNQIQIISINFLDTKVYEKIVNFIDRLDEQGPIEKNLRYGLWIGKDLQGHKIFEGHYEKGLKNGFWRDWDDEGHRVIREGFYRKGKKNGYWKVFQEDSGRLSAEGNFVNDTKQGYWRYYSPMSDSSGNFSEDRKVGIWTYTNPLRVKDEGNIILSMSKEYFF